MQNVFVTWKLIAIFRVFSQNKPTNAGHSRKSAGLKEGKMGDFPHHGLQLCNKQFCHLIFSNFLLFLSMSFLHGTAQHTENLLSTPLTAQCPVLGQFWPLLCSLSAMTMGWPVAQPSHF